jgi:hypothetical protein
VDRHSGNYTHPSSEVIVRIAFLTTLYIIGGSGVAEGQERYSFTPRSILEAHGDTVHWMHRTSATKVDTVVYLIRKDSSVRMLRPGPAHDLPDAVGRQLRFLFAEAKEGEALKAKLQGRKR